LVGKSEWKKPIGRPRCRWENNIRTYLGEKVWEVVNWIHLTEDRGQWQQWPFWFRRRWGISSAAE
jgi:hypothetical protein